MRSQILLLACLGLCGPAKLAAQTPAPPKGPPVEFRYLRPPQRSSWPKGLDHSQKPTPVHRARPTVRKNKQPSRPVSPASPIPAVAAAAPAPVSPAAAIPLKPAPVSAAIPLRHWPWRWYVLVTFLLAVAAGLWVYFRRRHYEYLRLDMQCWANACTQAFNQHFQNLPSQRRFLLDRKIKCHPAKHRFELWLRSRAFNYPQSPSENDSVRQTLQLFAQENPNPKFQAGEWTYRRGWVVIPFYQVPEP